MRTIGSNGTARTRTESMGSDAQRMAQMQAKVRVQQEIRDRESQRQQQVQHKARVQQEIREMSAQNDEDNGGLKEPSPGGLLPTPSFQVVKEEPKRRLWGIGGGKGRKGSGA